MEVERRDGGRGAKVRKREIVVSEAEPLEFHAVQVQPQAAAPGGETARCRIRHASGHVMEFAEMPEAVWLATLMNALASPAR
jgi:hypothetical protein